MHDLDQNGKKYIDEFFHLAVNAPDNFILISFKPQIPNLVFVLTGLMGQFVLKPVLSKINCL